MTSFLGRPQTRSKILLAIGAIGGLGLLLGIFALLQSSLAAVADHANAIDTGRSAEAMSAALQTSAKDMGDIDKEDTEWDDAVVHVYRPQIDTTWLYSNLGALTRNNANYDGAYVVTDDGTVLWGFADGVPAPLKDIRAFGPSFARLFAAYRQTVSASNPLGGPPASGLVRDASGLDLIAVGLIKPSSDKVKAPADQHRYLVMTRGFDHAVLDGYSHTFHIDDIRLERAAARVSRPHIAVRDADGAAIAQISWKPALPGAEAARAAWPQIRNSMTLIGLLVIGFVAVTIWGVRRLAASEQRTRLGARTDGLSGLPNRLALREGLRGLQVRGRLTVNAGMVLIDLDGFKGINSTFGHSIGDRLITLMADRLRAICPRDGLLVRLGGDEFGLLVTTGDTAATVSAFAEAALVQMGEAVTVGGHTLTIGAGIGMATAAAGTCSAEDLFRRADLAMSTIKAEGRTGLRAYTADLDAERQHRQALEAEICAGLDNNEFDVHYQPIVDAASHQPVAVEALVRWPRRPGGPLGPDAFIAAAESSGLIHRLGLFVLDRACRDLLPFGDIRLSVNLSPAQFRDVELEAKIAAILAATGFPARRLELEITEGYLIDHPERATALISGLNAMGLSVSLDDFGTGYTSIAYLQTYGFSRIKIDRSLAGAVDDDGSKAGVLVAGSVFLANGLDMSVTAEGVETEAQATLLRAAGCQCLQGYYFARPQPVTVLIETLGAWGEERALA